MNHVAHRLTLKVGSRSFIAKMKSDGIFKHALAAFVIALILYAGFFSLDQHLRTTKGPWHVTFTVESSGAPSIVINQPRLNITNLKIIFAGETATNPPGVVVFDIPQKPAPFGKVKFEDLTYLPGTVTFDFFGHEVELLPRTLYINRKEHVWKSGETITLFTTNKPAALPEARSKKKF